MGACASRQRTVKIMPTPPKTVRKTESETADHQMHYALLEYNMLKKEFKGAHPYVLGMPFINKMNGMRARIEAILMQIEIDSSARHGGWKSYYKIIDTALKEEVRTRFHDGRVRITADVLRVPGAFEGLVRPATAEKERGGSALF